MQENPKSFYSESRRRNGEELPECQIRRAMYAKENEERRKRLQKLQDVLDNEKSCYEKAKLFIRKICMYILNRE